MRTTIVPHFHYDVAYLRTFEEYLPLCFDNLREAIRILEAEPEYRFLIEQAILLEAFRERCPADFDRLRACAARGQVEVACGMWSMPDMNFPSGESLIRQALVGRAWVREHLGLDVPTCWIADCWGHPASLPQILRHCGYGLYAFSRGMRPEVGRADFRWRGLDGTEIQAHWMPIGYGPLLFPDAAQIENALEQDVTRANEERLRGLLERIRPALDTPNALLGNGGDFARPQAGGPAMLRAWRAAGHDVRFGTTSDYAETVREYALPVVEGEFNPIFTGSYAARIAIKQANRALEYKLAAAERAYCVLRGAHCGPPDADDGLAPLWKTALKNQFHDIASGTIVDAANEQVMAEYADALAAADAFLTEALQAMAGDAGEGAVIVFNPSGFARREVVSLPAGLQIADCRLQIAPDAEGQAESLAEIELAPLQVRVLPAAGRPAAQICNPQSAICNPIVLDTGALRVTVAPDGTLSSVVAGGREFVDPARPYWGDLLYRSDNGDLWLLDRSPLDGGSLASRLCEDDVRDPYARAKDPLVNSGPFCQHGGRHRATLVENGPLRWRVRVEGTLSFWRNRVEFETLISLHAGSRRIDFETRIVPRGRHFRLHACFPTALRGGRIRHEVAFGIQERDERLFPAQNWVDLSDGGQGVCLLNCGIPGSQVCDGVLSLLLFRAVAMEYKGESEAAFGEGVPHTFRYAVLPFGPDDEYLPHRDGEALNLPFALLEANGVKGSRAACAAIDPLPQLLIDPPQVHLAACYRRSHNVILRLYEATGRACDAEVRLPWGFDACREADGLETPGPAVPVRGGAVRLHFGPFQIRTLMLCGR